MFESRAAHHLYGKHICVALLLAIIICYVLPETKYKWVWTTTGKASATQEAWPPTPKAVPTETDTWWGHYVEELCRVKTFASKDTRTSNFLKSLPSLAKRRESHHHISRANLTPAGPPKGVMAAARMYPWQLSRLDPTSSHRRAVVWPVTAPPHMTGSEASSIWGTSWGKAAR